jgi:hypothetical protein
MATLHIHDYRHAPLCELEDLWPIDPVVEATWKARRGRRLAVKGAGIIAIVAILAGTVRLAESRDARGAMVAWGTMGGITPSAAVHAAAAAPAHADPIPAAPVAQDEAAPAPAPAAEPPAPAAAASAKPAAAASAKPVAAPAPVARKAARRSHLEDPYSDPETAPRAAQNPDLSDPY